MFERTHHLRIATALQSLNAELLHQHKCLFGGGTAIILARGEYRESIDIDFLISDRKGYQGLRSMITNTGMSAITRPGMEINTIREPRADQYGIRAMLRIAETEIKMEIIFEGRISLESPIQSENICGLSVLTSLDMASTKLLANSDRGSDDSVFSRDLIDLAMLRSPRNLLSKAIEKSAEAYGSSIERDLKKAIHTLGQRKGRLEECMTALKIDKVPPALLWKYIKNLAR